MISLMAVSFEAHTISNVAVISHVAFHVMIQATLFPIISLCSLTTVGIGEGRGREERKERAREDRI